MRLSSIPQAILRSYTKSVFVAVSTIACFYSLPAHADVASSVSFQARPPAFIPPELAPRIVEILRARAEATAAEQRLAELELEEILKTRALAAKLVNNFWDAVKKQKVAAYAKMLAARFQGLNTDGVFDRAQQIASLKSLTVKKFKVSHLFAARYKDTLTVSYNFDAVGKGIVSGPSIDVWKKINNKWVQISHSYVPYQ